MINEMSKSDPHQEEANNLYDPYEFLDDVTGKGLNKDLAKAARRLEMQFFKKMKVYEKVPRWEAARKGCKVISTRWLDINKGDQANPNYRSRLVGREIKTDTRLDLFAATPPLESLRLICSICASNQDRTQPYRIMSIDVRRAYFYAKATRPMYVETPIEDFEPGDEGKVARLNLSLYGTRDAAQNWAKEYTSFLKECGFTIGKVSPCNFSHPEKELALTVHGDDFTVTGPTTSLKWLQKKMEAKYEIKTDMLGPETGMSKEVQILNRTLSWKGSGITYEADQRHAEIVIEQMNMKKGSAVSTPAVAEASDEVERRLRSPELTGESATKYSGLAARINYLSLDRSDLQYAAKTVSRYMSQPREHDWGALKRIARYLVGAPRAVQTFRWQSSPGYVTTYVDSDWAGDKASRKSTIGSAMCLGSHMIKSWSTTQQVIAMSSGEAELYAMVKGASQTKCLMSMMLDYGLEVDAKVCSDVSAAIGIAHRRGLGKTRHSQVQYLWVQNEVAEGRRLVKKIGTDDNPADLLTKALAQDKAEKHLEALDINLKKSRARSAPTLST